MLLIHNNNVLYFWMEANIRRIGQLNRGPAEELLNVSWLSNTCAYYCTVLKDFKGTIGWCPLWTRGFHAQYAKLDCVLQSDKVQFKHWNEIIVFLALCLYLFLGSCNGNTASVYTVCFDKAYSSQQSRLFIFPDIWAVIHTLMLVVLPSQIDPHALIRLGMNNADLPPCHIGRECWVRDSRVMQTQRKREWELHSMSSKNTTKTWRFYGSY